MSISIAYHDEGIQHVIVKTFSHASIDEVLLQSNVTSPLVCFMS